MIRRRAILMVRSHQARLERAAMNEQEAQPAPPAETEDLDRDALAAEYEERFGRKPGNMKTETIAARLAEDDEAEEDDDAE